MNDSPSLRVGIVDDDPIARRVLAAWIAEAKLTPVEFATGREAIERAAELDIVCLDLGLDDMSGLDVLHHLGVRAPQTTVIVVTADTKVESAVQSMRAGAYDYLSKPVDRSRLAMVLSRAGERAELLRRIGEKDAQEETRKGALVGESSPMRELSRQIRNVLDSDIAVCVRGESGTGKELVARAIHERGRRARGPFVAVNCAAIPQSLQESELFGHERGAFTGALVTRKGSFEQANGGTLFLDEIGEMSAMTQASLLRTLQEKTIRRVGGNVETPINVRVVCATHRDLEEEVKAGRFREDLYFRLVVYPIVVPPLRSRNGDVPLLVAHMLNGFRADVGRGMPRLHPDALEALSRYAWPGNVRELQNAIHRAMLSCDDGEIRLRDLPAAVRELSLPALPSAPSAPVAAAGAGALPTSPTAESWTAGDTVPTIAELERMAITRAIAITGGNVQKAARMLGLGRATLYRRLSELEVAPGVSAPVPNG